ncbi:hypothetical protein MMC11_005554 [Xylographa trunciseda]|nr:hypothetical protein [Xylographa trunciseda]
MQTRSSRSSVARTNTSRRRISYREESSSDGSGYESPDELHAESPKPKRFARSRRPPPATTITRKRKIKSVTLGRPLKRTKVKLDSGSNHDNTLKEQGKGMHTIMEVSPLWHTLPYEILLQVFQYASYPLSDSRFEPTDGISWLLRNALVCKAFAEPSLSALYYSPPLRPPTRARGLLACLTAQSSSSTFNYKSKVKYLEIEATSVLLHKYQGFDPISLDELIRLTPQVRGIGIHLLSDQPEYRAQLSLVSKRPGVVYNKAMFDALRDTKVRLLKWKWNLNFNHPGATRDSYPWAVLKDLHSEAPFQTLRSLSIVKYESKQAMTELELASAIKALPNLSRLNLESWATYSGKLLPLLPQGLESLRIASCSALTSESFHAFLLTHGGNLRDLILDHNQSLDLAFLVDFAIACPLLEIFSMKMTFFSPYSTTYDAEPKFGALLLPGILPTWPTTLRSIELIQLRKWYSDSAEVFLNSLTDSAPELLQLRHLVLKGSVEGIGWRDRASFRDRWIGKLRKVFLRHSLPPTNIYIPKAPVIEEDLMTGETSQPHSTSESQYVSPRRSGLRRQASQRLSHIEIPKDVLSTESDSDTPIVPRSTRQSKRLQEQEHNSDYGDRATSTGPADQSKPGQSDDTDSGSPNILNEEEGDGKLFIHGMCDVVDIRIDNLRPAENQFSENDFLDEERSGDEDWDGDDGQPGDGGYAW